MTDRRATTKKYLEIIVHLVRLGMVTSLYLTKLNYDFRCEREEIVAYRKLSREAHDL
ncbi:8151_t:CDS:1, partial [Acaulospora morrowiae]